MSKKCRNSNRQAFMNHVDAIRNMEADKDTFLKASRLERHESHSQPFTARQKIALCAIGGAGVVFKPYLYLAICQGILSLR